MIEKITFRGELPDSFFEIPKKIYQNDTYYKPESTSYTLELFREEAQRSDIFLYTDHQNIRLVGFFPKNEAMAYAGFWETTNDLPLNWTTFELLFEEMRARNLYRLLAPINFNTYQSYRLRLSSPVWKPFVGEPNEPLYYSQILRDMGFDTHTRYESRLLRKEQVPLVYVHKQEILETLENIPFEMLAITPETWQALDKEIFVLIEAIFSANPFYKSISWEQFSRMYNLTFVRQLCPYSSVLFRDKKTKALAAISLCLPHYAYASVSKKNYSFTEDYPHLTSKILLAKSVGVHPLFRGHNLMNYLAAYAMLSFREYYDEIIFCTMRSDNLSLRFSDAFPHEKAEYAIFSKTL